MVSTFDFENGEAHHQYRASWTMGQKRNKPINKIIRGITYPIIAGWILSKLYLHFAGEDFHTDHVINLFRPLWDGGPAPALSGADIDINAGTWNFRGEKNGLKTFSKAVPGSPVMALRGTGVLNMHVSTAVGTFLDAYRCYLWVDMLDLMTEMDYDPKTVVSAQKSAAVDGIASGASKGKSKGSGVKGIFGKLMGSKSGSTDRSSKPEVYDVGSSDLSKDLAKKAMTKSENSWGRKGCLVDKNKLAPKSQFKWRDLVYQRLKLPWPIYPRELLIWRDWHFDEREKTVRMTYKSVEDERVPHTPGYIRAEATHMLWHFEKRPAKAVINAAGLTEYQDQTYVEVECFVDSKGSIPPWFINYLQGSWPTKVLREFQRLVDGAKGYEPWPGLVNW